MSPVARRIVYVGLYEALAIVFASLGLALFSGEAVDHTGPLAIMCSLVAVAWNFVFNSLFERWEAGRPGGRGFLRRAAHAIGFEFGLVVLLVPVLAWWLDASLVEALVYDLALTVFFVVYTFVFTRAFDAAFGLPASVRT